MAHFVQGGFDEYSLMTKKFIIYYMAVFKFILFEKINKCNNLRATLVLEWKKYSATTGNRHDGANTISAYKFFCYQNYLSCHTTITSNKITGKTYF